MLLLVSVGVGVSQKTLIGSVVQAGRSDATAAAYESSATCGAHAVSGQLVAVGGHARVAQQRVLVVHGARLVLGGEEAAVGAAVVRAGGGHVEVRLVECGRADRRVALAARLADGKAKEEAQHEARDGADYHSQVEVLACVQVGLATQLASNEVRR